MVAELACACALLTLQAYINKLLAFEEAYNAEQIDAEIVLAAGGTPEPAAKAPPKRKAAVPAGECGEQPKAKRERQQPKQPQPQQQQQQRKRAKEEHEGAGLVVASPQAPQHPPSRPRAKQARPSHKRAASPMAAEAGKGGRSAKAATCLPSTAAGRGGRQDGGVAPGPEARPPSGQRGKVRRANVRGLLLGHWKSFAGGDGWECLPLPCCVSSC